MTTRKKNNHKKKKTIRKRKHILIIGGEYVKASPIECLIKECYTQDSNEEVSDKNANGIDTNDIKLDIPDTSNTSANKSNLAPPPSNASISTPINKTNISTIPPANTSSNDSLANSDPQVSPSNNDQKKSFFSNLKDKASEGFNKVRGKINEEVAKLRDKASQSKNTVDVKPATNQPATNQPATNQPNNTVLGWGLGKIASDAIATDPNYKNLPPDVIKALQSGATAATSTINTGQFIKGSRALENITNGNKGAITPDDLNTAKQMGINAVIKKTGGKKRKSKKRTNKKRKTCKKRSKK